MKIDIEGLNKVKLVKALYDAAIPTEKTDMNKVIKEARNHFNLQNYKEDRNKYTRSI